MSKSKKKTKRGKLKYPALNPSVNLRVRRPYIETEYINGVLDPTTKEQVIRPLNDDEKKWLNKFYQETIITTFKKDGTDLYPDQEDQRAFYRDNNKRNTCLYNFLSNVRMLSGLNWSELEDWWNRDEGLDVNETMLLKQDNLNVLKKELLRNVDFTSKKTIDWKVVVFYCDIYREGLTAKDCVKLINELTESLD